MFQELLQRIISFKGVAVDYKPFLVFIESHYAFKSEFEGLYINPCCLLVCVPECLLVGKFGH